MRLALFAVVLWASVAAAALPQGEQILKTRDGRTLRGVVLSETQQGYLFRMTDTTELVPFSNIEDLTPVEVPPVVPTGPVAPPPPPYVPPDATPVPPPDETQPRDEREPPEEVPAGPDWRAERKGFHWSLGLGAMIDPTGSSGGKTTVAFFVGGVASVRWGFGWLDLSAELMPLGYFKGAIKAFFLAANPQLRINFARFFSLGVGLLGAVVISPSVDFCLGPSFSPAIFRLGADGQHEIRFWVGSPIIATSNELTGSVLMLLSYSYVF